MNKDMQIKQHVLEMIKSLMMGNSGDKFKPVAMEVVMAKPGKDKESDKDDLDEVLEEASRKNPISDEEKDEMMDEEGIAHEDEYDDEDEDNEEEDDKVMNLRKFMGRK